MRSEQLENGGSAPESMANDGPLNAVAERGAWHATHHGDVLPVQDQVVHGEAGPQYSLTEHQREAPLTRRRMKDGVPLSELQTGGKGREQR